MIGLVTLATVSLGMALLGGWNLKNCILEGRTSAYGHSYYRHDKPVAFWVGSTVSALATLLGLGISFVAWGGILGLIK